MGARRQGALAPQLPRATQSSEFPSDLVSPGLEYFQSFLFLFCISPFFLVSNIIIGASSRRDPAFKTV